MKESTETLVDPAHEEGPGEGSEPREAAPAAPEGKRPKGKRKRAAAQKAPVPSSAGPSEGASEGASEGPGSAGPERPGEAPASGDGPVDDDPSQPAGEEAHAPEADPLSDDELLLELSALLFASAQPLSPAKLASLVGARQARVKQALELLAERLGAAGLGFELRALAGGFLFMTRPELSDTVAKLSKHAAVERISAAALETLAVIAYRQPVTKAEIEAIRGVQAGPILRALVDRGLAKVVGRAEVPGHPLQYGTTKEFLDRFGLESVSDLPRDGELARD